MTKGKLASLVEGLQAQVDQLAEVLSLELSKERDYVQMLIEAHRRMSELSEQISRAPDAAVDDEEGYNQLLSHTNELSGAMQSFLNGEPRIQQTPSWTTSHAPHDRPTVKYGNDAHVDERNPSILARKLSAAANRCRERRQEMSLVLVEPVTQGGTTSARGDRVNRAVRRALGNACLVLEQENVTLLSMSDARIAAIIADCDRRSALAIARNAIRELTGDFGANDGNTTMLSVGVATLCVVPKNFDPGRLIESATRCLLAARACGISAVKSIEV
jgi:hypothetical protein